eukprot:7169291-Prymnesium_polylepis.1
MSEPVTSHWPPTTRGVYSSGHSPAIGPPGATGRRAVVMGGKRREGSSIWIHAVFRRLHGWALLLLYDHDCKAWCHNGHGSTIQ